MSVEKVKIDLQFGETHIKGEFPKEIAAQILKSVLGGNGNNEQSVPKAEPIHAPQVIYPQVIYKPILPPSMIDEAAISNPKEHHFYGDKREIVNTDRFLVRSTKGFGRKYHLDFNLVFKEASNGKDFVSRADLAKLLGRKSYRSIGGRDYYKMESAARKVGFSKSKGGWSRGNTEMPKEQKNAQHGYKYSSPVRKLDYDGIFKKLSEGRDILKVSEFVPHLGVRENKIQNMGALRYKFLIEAANKQGFTLMKHTGKFVRQSSLIEQKPKVTSESTSEPISKIPENQIQPTIYLVAKQMKTFTIGDVLKAIKSQPFSYMNPDYPRIAFVANQMVQMGILGKNVIKTKGYKANLFNLLRKEDKEDFVPEDEQKRMPPDTNEEVIKNILNNFGSFNATALMGINNKYGSRYTKYSALGLFNWIYSNTNKVTEITGKKLAALGTGDYRYLQVLA